MQIVFIHGWGFDKNFWNPLAVMLPEYDKQFVDLGFFGETQDLKKNSNQILVGHSLGFIEGMNLNHDWAGWIAINSFSNFVINHSGIGCVAFTALRAIKKRLQHDTQNTLADFYRLIGADVSTSPSTPDKDKLSLGLDHLRDAEITTALETKLPSMVLAASHDPIVPLATSQALAKHSMTVNMHANAGHILPQSDPLWCANHIRQFIGSNFEVET